MRGGGRNREIQRLQAAAAQNGGEGTARQQERLSYLQSHRDAGRRPQGGAQAGAQTGGKLLEAMAPSSEGNYKDNIRMGPGGQDAIRTQQPWNGGPGMSNGGTTWDGQAPMNPYGGGQPIRSGSDSGFPGREAMDAMRRPQGGKFGADGRLKMPTAQELEQSAQENGRRMGMTPDQFNQWRETANNNGIRNGLGQSTATPPGQSWQPMGQGPGMSLEDVRQLQREGKYIGIDPGFQKQNPPPMQRPTPGNTQDAVMRYPPGTQIPGLQQFGPGGAPVGKDPSVYAGNRGPDYFRGQGMDNGKFNQPGYQAPQRQVQGNQIAGGGTTMDRFSRPGYTAPQRNVAGDQIRGGGSPGLSRRRVNTDPNRRGQPAGVLAPIPR